MVNISHSLIFQWLLFDKISKIGYYGDHATEKINVVAIMRDLYPEIEPYKTGTLAVGDGHIIYWEQCGNPDGIPLLLLHGGPGGACFPRHRRFFDPKRYNIILFDQRGCGKSTPFASTENNTTPHLLADIEKLRIYLDIKQWVLFGHSWGSSLAIAYAVQYKSAVSGVIIGGVWLGRPDEIKNYVQPHGLAAAMFPDAYQDYLSPLNENERRDPFAAYIKILHHPTSTDATRSDACLRQWHTWETVLMTMEYPLSAEKAAEIEDDIAKGFSRSVAMLETHYISQSCFIDADKILSQLKDLGDIPCLIYQGRVDAVCPVQTAFDVHKAWPNSSLTIVPLGSHWTRQPAMVDAIVSCTDKMATLV
jgi:proline iminopeptidase